MKNIDDISADVLDLALRIHRDPGPGLLESVYESVGRLTAAHAKQVLTYSRLTKQPVGPLINFAGATLEEGVRRLVNDHRSSASPRESIKGM